MRLLSMTPLYFGPFSEGQTLDLDERITVLTGSNDVGKSALLKLLWHLGAPNDERAILQPEVNARHVQTTGNPWDQSDVGARARFIVTERSDLSRLRLEVGDEVDVRYRLAPKSLAIQLERVRRGGTTVATGIDFNASAPIRTQYIATEGIRDEIDLSNPTSQERRLLAVAFQTPDPKAKLAALDEVSAEDLLEDADAALNMRLASVLPKRQPLSFKLRLIAPGRLLLRLTDQQGARIPLGRRGSGLRRMLNVAASLALLEGQAGHILLLLDEPETSLHADAQHGLRSLLEAVAELPGTQIVYATHSSAMLNGLHPERVRVLVRERGADQPLTRIRNLDGSFALVRSSIGLSLADSLLLGPVTVVLEGETETSCLVALLVKLETGAVEGFERVSSLLGQCALLDGRGDNFERLARVIESLGSAPVVLVDGDKAPRLQRVREAMPHVPALSLPGRMEFEELVPAERYFAALTAHLGKEIELSAYQAWEASTEGIPQQMAFTKRIQRWLGVDLDKPAVMELAVQATPANEIKTEPLLELVRRIADVLERNARLA